MEKYSNCYGAELGEYFEETSICPDCGEPCDVVDGDDKEYELPTVDVFNPMEVLDDLCQEAKNLTKNYGK